VARFLADDLRARRPDVVHVTSCERLSASVINVAKDAGVPVVLSLTDFWFLCPRLTLMRTDGENCSGETTGWECTTCVAGHARAIKWPRAMLPDAVVEPLVYGLANVPWVARQRGIRGQIGDVNARKRFLRAAFARADARFTASTFVRDRLAANGFDAPVTVRPYGHDIAWLDSAPPKVPSSSRLRVGFIGQIVRHKGVHVLLDAVRRLPQHVRARLDVSIYGDPDQSPEYLEELTRMMGDPPLASFMGIYAHDETGHVFATLDVLVVPSLWFDFPLVIHESIASGTPVVATRLGAMTEVITHGVNGLLFERGNAQELADDLRTLVETPTMLDTLRSGMAPVRTIGAEVDEFEQLYEGLAGGRTRQQHFGT
jgi:glycosyltransferase involved in cell wall biosynthesis